MATRWFTLGGAYNRAVLRSSRALRTLAWGVVVVGVAAPLVRRRLRLRVPVVTALSFSAPVALALAMPRSRGRDAGIYALQMWAYYATYDMPDDDPEHLRARTHVDYPVTIDRLLGRGTLPTHRLQRSFGTPGEVRPHDLLLSAVHWSWFLVPHGTAAYMLLAHHDQFVRSAVLIAGAFDAGVIIYWSLPTAPPWYAAEQGRIPPVRRIMVESGERFWKALWRPLYDGLEGNPFAAMPSLHFGISVMAAHVLSGAGRTQGAVGWIYAITLGFGLVYLGEHYVVDLLAGLALAEGVRLVEPHARPLLEAAGRTIQRLEPGRA